MAGNKHMRSLTFWSQHCQEPVLRVQSDPILEVVLNHQPNCGSTKQNHNEIPQPCRSSLWIWQPQAGGQLTAICMYMNMPTARMLPLNANESGGVIADLCKTLNSQQHMLTMNICMRCHVNIHTLKIVTDALRRQRAWLADFMHH